VTPDEARRRRTHLAEAAERLDDVAVEVLRLGLPDLAPTLQRCIDRLYEEAEKLPESGN
jgi:hypothetical protein